MTRRSRADARVPCVISVASNAAVFIEPDGTAIPCVQVLTIDLLAQGNEKPVVQRLVQGDDITIALKPTYRSVSF